jgi:hypothetical protein
MKKDSKHFRPRARIMELLGEQLIKNHTLALFELIKNSYDADSSEVDLGLVNINEPGGIIEVKDDGFGMDFDTVVNIWMEPAVGHKGETRKNDVRTDKGRLPVGEKGVGRFAVHRLGSKVCMVTRAKGKPEVFVDIDWSEFEKKKYLDEAVIDIREREPKIFLKEETGTKITISGLKQTWRRGDVRRLYRSVLGMTSGKISLDDINADVDFEVKFNIRPDKGWLEGFFDPLMARDQAMFFIKFQLSDLGFKYDYQFKPLEALKADYQGLIDDRKTGEINRNNFEFFRKRPPEDEGWRNRKSRSKRPVLGKEGLGIGSISGEIIGFDLDKHIKDRYLKDASGLPEFLKEQGGIRVYRDGLRVYNYGEPGDDWLGLDHRRIQRPTSKLSNQLILGQIHLDIEKSVNLTEKTNREGFIENDAYSELQYAVLCVLSEFEAERNKDKRILRDVLEIPPGSKNKKVKRKKSTEELLNDLKQIVLEKKYENELGDLVKQVTTTYVETRDVLMSAAGAGLGLVTVFHELERGVRNLHSAIEEELSVSKLKQLSKELVSLLKGAMYMVSRSRMEKISASQLVTYASSSQALRFKYHNIEFKNGFDNLPGQDFSIKGIRRMLTACLVNLIDNSIYWTEENTSGKRIIWVGPGHDLEGPAIVVADSGSGFIDAPEDIVQPFFSRKGDGMGIGLYYTDMVMKSHRGRLSFPEKGAVDVPKVCDGAVVALVFEGGDENAV